jgi:hypothetical protein
MVEACPGDSEEWARLGSNQRPLACEASALPLSYAPFILQIIAFGAMLFDRRVAARIACAHPVRKMIPLSLGIMDADDRPAPTG